MHKMSNNEVAAVEYDKPRTCKFVILGVISIFDRLVKHLRSAI